MRISLLIKMRLRRSRYRFTGGQILLGMILGVASGIYIWKPEFDKRYSSTVSQEELDRDRQKTLENFDLPESKADGPRPSK